MKPATLLTGSVLLVLLAPAAAADISLLNGNVVIHTDGDPGVSVLGSPAARLHVGPCFSGECVFVYSDPAGTGDVSGGLYTGHCGIGGEPEWDCILVLAFLGPDLEVAVGLLQQDGVTAVCVYNCVFVSQDPLCVRDLLVGEIVCEA